eukprot:GHVU01146701.1.p1 GENE.GHVU01146701.1~~GHVU01146701.1.p1  ORF type:complete len:192 (-),score=25.54 GHVU01146701.1:1114-1689(-)
MYPYLLSAPHDCTTAGTSSPPPPPPPGGRISKKCIVPSRGDHDVHYCLPIACLRSCLFASVLTAARLRWSDRATTDAQGDSWQLQQCGSGSSGSSGSSISSSSRLTDSAVVVIEYMYAESCTRHRCRATVISEGENDRGGSESRSCQTRGGVVVEAMGEVHERSDRWTGLLEVLVRSLARRQGGRPTPCMR